MATTPNFFDVLKQQANEIAASRSGAVQPIQNQGDIAAPQMPVQQFAPAPGSIPRQPTPKRMQPVYKTQQRSYLYGDLDPSQVVSTPSRGGTPTTFDDQFLQRLLSGGSGLLESFDWGKVRGGGYLPIGGQNRQLLVNQKNLRSLLESPWDEKWNRKDAMVWELGNRLQSKTGTQYGIGHGGGLTDALEGGITLVKGNKQKAFNSIGGWQNSPNIIKQVRDLVAQGYKIDKQPGFGQKALQRFLDTGEGGPNIAGILLALSDLTPQAARENLKEAKANTKPGIFANTKEGRALKKRAAQLATRKVVKKKVTKKTKARLAKKGMK